MCQFRCPEQHKLQMDETSAWFIGGKTSEGYRGVSSSRQEETFNADLQGKSGKHSRRRHEKKGRKNFQAAAKI